MESIITKSVLGKLLLIFALSMPCLIILEVLPTEKAIVFFVLFLIGCSIFCWGLKGGVFSAVYSSLITLGLLCFAPWTANNYSPFMEISLYLVAGIVGGLLIKKPADAKGKVRQLPDLTEVKQAKIELDIARQNFEYAEEEIIDTAVFKLNEAFLKYDRLTRIH